MTWRPRSRLGLVEPTLDEGGDQVLELDAAEGGGCLGTPQDVVRQVDGGSHTGILT
jgi:hypothetical protein